MLSQALRALARVAVQGTSAVNRSLVVDALKHGKTSHLGLAVRHYVPARYDEPHLVARRCIQSGQLDKHGFYSWQELINYLAKQGDSVGVLEAESHGIAQGEKCVIPVIEDNPYGHRVSDTIFSNVPFATKRLDKGYFQHLAYKKFLVNGELNTKYFLSEKEVLDYAHKIEDWYGVRHLASKNIEMTANPFKISNIKTALAEEGVDPEAFVPPTSAEIAGSKVPDQFEANKYNPSYSQDTNS